MDVKKTAPYTYCNDNELAAIAKRNPTSMLELFGVKGFRLRKQMQLEKK